MRISCTLLVILLTCTAVFAAAEKDALFSENHNQVVVRNLQHSADGLSLEITLPDYNQAAINYKNSRELFSVTVPSTNVDNRLIIPSSNSFMRLPATGSYSVNLVNSGYEVLTGTDYTNWIENYLLEDYDNLDSNSDIWYPQNPVELGSPSIFKDFRVASLDVSPVQINPFRQEIRVFNDMNLEFELINDARNSLTSEPQRISQAFLPVYRNFLDWDESELDQHALYRGSILVVMRDNNPARNALEPWVEWKEQKGWEIQYIDDDDVNMDWAGDVRNEILERYENSDPPIDHIVILGDADYQALHVPAGTVGGFEPLGDHHYTTLAGNDELPDVTLGRISVSNISQIATYVAKVVNYEKEPYMNQTNWYKKGLVAAGSSVSGYTTVLLGRYARHLMINSGYTEVDTAWYNDGLGDQNTRIIESLNDGVSFYLYRGLLGTGLDNGQISSLTNNNMTPVVLDITCGTGNWVSGTGLNESYMRAGTVSNGRGGIGAFGTATSHTNTRFNNALCGGVLEAAFVLNTPELGILGLNGKLNMCKNFADHEDALLSDYSLWFNLMGDPTVWIWTDIPEQMDVDYPDNLYMSDGTVEVTVSDDGTPLENAWVTIYKEDFNERDIFRGITNSSGEVSIPVHFNSTGEAILTVTKRNYHPLQVTLDVDNPDNGVSAQISHVIDNNQSGRQGNDNGIAEAGETVEIFFDVLNVGQNTLTNVTMTGSSNDDFVESISGNENIGTLFATSETPETVSLLVEINESTPDLWMLEFDLVFNTNSGELITSQMIESNSSNFDKAYPGVDIYVNSSGSDNISFWVKNIGSSSSEAGSARLESLDPALTVVTASVNYNSVQAGHTLQLNPIMVNANNGTMNGLMVPANLIMESNSGRLDTVDVNIKFGEENSGTPTGPDNYGYYAHENSDMSALAPNFTWIEINPDDENGMKFGNQLDLNDDKGINQDQAVVVDLPFPITYYGITYDEMTVCSNGWVAMGSQNDNPAPRNWRIPAPVGPAAMIAPYWDNRILVGDAAVYEYHDDIANTYTIEWYKVRDALSENPCTFQVVFYENEEFPTGTGDTEFVFNYLTMNHSMGLAQDVGYWTTGIENQNQTDGLELSYWNERENTVSLFTAGRSILFSTRTAIETASVTGSVVDASNNSPIQNAIVFSEFPGKSTSTNFTGSFNLSLPLGMNKILVMAQGYNNYVIENLEVIEDGVDGLQIALTQPEFFVSDDAVELTLNRGMSNTLQLTVSNSGNGTLAYMLDILPEDNSVTASLGITHPNELDDPGSFLDEIVLDPGNGESNSTGITTDGEYFWVLGRSTQPDRIYRYSLDGEFEESFQQPSTYCNHEDIATDGEYLYAVDNFSFYSYRIMSDGDLYYEDHVNIDMIVNDQPTSLTYDPDRGYLWTACSDGFLTAYSTNGRDRITHTYPYDIEEIAWNSDDPDGYYIYAVVVNYSNDRMLVRIEPSSGAHDEIVELDSVSDSRIRSMHISRTFDPWIVTAAMLIDEVGNGHDRIEFRQISVDLDWVNVSDNPFTIAPGEDRINYIQFDTGTLPSGNYNAWLRFSHNAMGRFEILPVTLNISGADVDDDNITAEIPLEWKFDGAWPNPFNPSTSVAFTLKNRANVKATIFNVLGQQVATLANREMIAGHHTLSFDGKDLSSGMYFLKFQAGPLNSTSKLMLIK